MIFEKNDPRKYLAGRLAGDTQEREALIAFTGELFDCQRKALNGLGPVIASTAAKLQPAIDSGRRPLGAISFLCGQWPGVADLFREIERVTASCSSNTRFPPSLNRDQVLEFARAWINFDRKPIETLSGERWNNDPARGRFILIYTLYPFLSMVSDRLVLPDHDFYLSRCPVCGGTPLGASLTEAAGEDSNNPAAGGRVRRLHCSFCGTAWRYLRPKCPFCLEEDPSKLGFFELEGWPGSRADYCDTCRRYLKTLLFMPEDKISFLWEDICTCELDLSAQRQDFF